MSKRYVEIALLALLAGFTSCSEKPDEPEPTPAEVPAITLDSYRFNRYADGGDVEVYVNAEEGASYQVTIPSNITWVTTTATSGNKSEYVSFSVKPNDTNFDRTASITFQYGPTQQRTLKINQNASEITDLYEHWGIEGSLQASVSNERSYNWYIDQGETGPYSSSNCGPSSATMVARWYDKNYHDTVQEARKHYQPTGGWWNTDKDLLPFLASIKIPVQTVKFEKSETLVDYLDKGAVAIICLDMNVLSYQLEVEKRVHRFYKTSPGWGHFMVIMGYVQTDKELYYQCYDPYSLSVFYIDKMPKGQGRYYSASELQRSASEWSPNVFVINQK